MQRGRGRAAPPYDLLRFPQITVPQHLRTMCLRPDAVNVMTTSNFLPQILHVCPAAFAACRAATSVFDFFPSLPTVHLLTCTSANPP